MQEILFILAKTVSIALEVVSFTMLIRMILSFFTDTSENHLYMITCYITEPFIAPVRAIMIRLNVGQDSPIDWSFSITYILIWLISALLPAI